MQTPLTIRCLRGFALPDLLLAVLVFVSLGLVSYAAFQRHTLRARAQEAPFQLRRITEGFRGAYEEGRSRDKNSASFPHLATPFTPPEDPCFQGRLFYPASLSPWESSVWKRLRFDITTPHLYQYRIQTKVTGDLPGFSIEARGDINCDRTFSEWKLRGQRSPSGELDILGLFVLHPLE